MGLTGPHQEEGTALAAHAAATSSQYCKPYKRSASLSRTNTRQRKSGRTRRTPSAGDARSQCAAVSASQANRPVSLDTCRQCKASVQVDITSKILWTIINDYGQRWTSPQLDTAWTAVNTCGPPPSLSVPRQPNERQARPSFPFSVGPVSPMHDSSTTRHAYLPPRGWHRPFCKQTWVALHGQSRVFTALGQKGQPQAEQ
eukprot:365861-Chlamydomonas_euryale.AAC.46